MTFSKAALTAVCLNFCKEIQSISEDTERFLSLFQAEARLQFTNAEQIKQQYFVPYGRLVSSLVASLSRSDGLGVQLSALLISTDCPEYASYYPCVEARFIAYEQYRQAVTQYLDNARRYWHEKHSGTSPLVLATRSLIQAQREALAIFEKAIA